jgi:hypothetical protein
MDDVGLRCPQFGLCLISPQIVLCLHWHASKVSPDINVNAVFSNRDELFLVPSTIYMQ